MISKQFTSVLLSHQNILSGFVGAVLYVLIGIFTVTVLGPLLVGRGHRQSQLKDITVVIPNHGVDITVTSLRSSGFRTIHAMSFDPSITSHTQFKTLQRLHGEFGSPPANLINTSFVLFSGPEVFTVPSNLPSLPDKPMVIGYSFAQCYEKGYGLLLPTQLEYSLVSKEALKRFGDWVSNALKTDVGGSAEFRRFCDFHSLHLLVMPCGRKVGRLPKWESINVIEYPYEGPLEPWDSLPMFEEIWTVRDMI
jgi:hypothetical protein